MKISTQEITVYNTLTSRSDLLGNADLLLYCLKEGVHHSTPPVQIDSQLVTQGTDNSLDHHRQVRSEQVFEQTS